MARAADSRMSFREEAVLAARAAATAALEGSTRRDAAGQGRHGRAAARASTAGEREGYGGREAADQGPEGDSGGGAIRIRTRRGADAQSSQDTEVRLLSLSTAEVIYRGRIWIGTRVRSITCVAAGAYDLV